METRSPRPVRSAAPLRRLPSVSLRGAVAMWRRDLVVYSHSWRGNILPNFLEPIVYLAVLGSGLGRQVDASRLGSSYVVFLAPGLAAATVMTGAVYEATFSVFVKLRLTRVYSASIVTPLGAEDVALGELLWATTRGSLYGVGLLALMAALDYTRAPSAVLAVVGIPLLGLVFAEIGVVFTSLVSHIDDYSYFYGLFISPIFLFSGVFFPLDDLPGPVAALAWCTPLYHGVAMMRALTVTGDLGAGLGHAAWLAVVAAVLLVPTLTLFRRRLLEE